MVAFPLLSLIPDPLCLPVLVVRVGDEAVNKLLLRLGSALGDILFLDNGKKRIMFLLRQIQGF